MPLDVIRSQARIRLARAGDATTRLFLHDAVYRAGEVIQPGRAEIVVPRDSVIVFADDEPGKNWGHRCRYLLHDPKSGELIGELPALLPPTFDFGERFVAFHEPAVASAALEAAVYWPVVSLPWWIFGDQARRWHAILYAGASMNRHVNDLEFLYRTLVNVYRVPKSRITVLSYDGTLTYNDADWQRHVGSIGNWPGNNTAYQMKIDGSGTRAELLAAIAAVGEKLGAKDNLLLHTNNHGNTVGGVSTIISYQGDDTTQSDLADAIGALPKFNSLMVMMEQCFAGGFIDPIVNASPASCTSVATAVDANTSSDGGADFDPFALAWINAITGAHADGSALSPAPATDAAGFVTAQGAFDYAKATDTGPDDDPQFSANACGAATSLGAERPHIIIPIPWRYLFPWEIIPDPGPEEIARLATQIEAEVRSGRLATPLETELDRARLQVSRLVKKQLKQGGTRRG
jgi:hypothetical protein